jgi:hypothetical protein
MYLPDSLDDLLIPTNDYMVEYNKEDFKLL